MGYGEVSIIVTKSNHDRQVHAGSSWHAHGGSSTAVTHRYTFSMWAAFLLFLTISAAVNANTLKTLWSAEERSLGRGDHREHREKSRWEVQSGCCRPSWCLSCRVLYCRKLLFCRVTRRLSSPTPCQQWYLFASSTSSQTVSDNILYGVLLCLNNSLMFKYSLRQTAAL